MSNRSQRSDYVRVFPDEMTFFRFTPHSVIIDESYFPVISFDGGSTWISSVDFTDKQDLELDKPLRMIIKYKFPQVAGEPRRIKLKAKANCVLKDAQLELGADGTAETQVVFRGDSIGFKIAEEKKEYPFAVFNNSKLKIKDLEWL
jgi:hypothetical protein